MFTVIWGSILMTNKSLSGKNLPEILIRSSIPELKISVEHSVAHADCASSSLWSSPSSVRTVEGSPALKAVRAFAGRYLSSSSSIHNQSPCSNLLIFRNSPFRTTSDAQRTPHKQSISYTSKRLTLKFQEGFSGRRPTGGSSVFFRPGTRVLYLESKEYFILKSEYMPTSTRSMSKIAWLGVNNADFFNLHKLFAVVGASTDRTKFGNKVLRCYQKRGYPCFPINAKSPEIEGLKTHATLTALHATLVPPMQMKDMGISIITGPAITDGIIREAYQVCMRFTLPWHFFIIYKTNMCNPISPPFPCIPCIHSSGPGLSSSSPAHTMQP